MARIKHPTSGRSLGRSRIDSPSRDTITDDGTTLVSVVDGEQIQIEITVGWIADLSSATITAKVVEGANDGTGAVPTTAQPAGQVITLPIIDSVTTDNKFKLVIPETLIDSWAQQPTVDKPVYGFLGLEIDDGGVGNAKQVWKPLRGLVEVLYSPSEA